MNQEHLEQLKSALPDEVILAAKEFNVVSKGYFFISQRENAFAPFKLGGFCPKEGVFEKFIAFGDAHSAKMLLNSLNIR